MQTHVYTTHQNTRTIISYALFLVAAVFPIHAANASILSVTATPISHNITMGRSASVSISWTVIGGGQTPLGTNITSQQSAFFIPGGQTSILLGNVNTPLSKNNPGAASISIGERLLIPASIIAKARSLGANQFLYSRAFNDGTPSPQVGTISLNITGSAGAEFSISREALSFTDK